MKVLMCHTRYQVRGGEDESFAAEADLMERHGHSVIRFERTNDALEAMGGMEIVGRTVWNHAVYRELRTLMRRERPDVMHCTNLFPLLSPATYYAARAEGVPVLQSLRNYRLHCLNSFFFRDGAVCESCLGRTMAWPGIARGCYRKGRAASAVVATMLASHRLIGTWRRGVDLYFTVSEFARQKLIAGGMPPDRIAVKPNFVHPDPGAGTGAGGYAVFVGRLSPEKGIETMLEAWTRIDESIPLRIIGDGPLADRVRSVTEQHPRIQWLGRRSPAEIMNVVGEASVLVMPSIWYETFGRTIVEGFARGTPVVSSNLGAMAELVDHGRTGLLVEPGRPDELARGVTQIVKSDTLQARMRPQARAAYLASYTAERNYELLMGLYRRVLDTRHRAPAAQAPASMTSSASESSGRHSA